VPPLREELVKLGIEKKVQQLSRTVKEPNAQSFLGYIRRAFGDMTAAKYDVDQEKCNQILNKESLILSCSNCGRESAPDLPLKKCGACGTVQYCGKFVTFLS